MDLPQHKSSFINPQQQYFLMMRPTVFLILLLLASSASADWVSPGWSQELNYIIKYSNGTRDTHADLDTVIWGDVEKVGVARKNQDSILSLGGFSRDYYHMILYPTIGYTDKPALHGFMRLWVYKNSVWHNAWVTQPNTQKTIFYFCFCVW